MSGELKYNNLPILRYPAREITPPQVDTSLTLGINGERGATRNADNLSGAKKRDARTVRLTLNKKHVRKLR